MDITNLSRCPGIMSLSQWPRTLICHGPAFNCSVPFERGDGGPAGVLLATVRLTSGQPAESHQVSREVCGLFLHSFEPPLLLLQNQEIGNLSLCSGMGFGSSVQGNPCSGGPGGHLQTPASLSAQAALGSDPCSPNCGKALLQEALGFSLDGRGVLRVASLAPSCSPMSDVTRCHLAALTPGPSLGPWWLLAHGCVVIPFTSLRAGADRWWGGGRRPSAKAPVWAPAGIPSPLSWSQAPSLMLSQDGLSPARGLPGPLLTGPCQAAPSSRPVF